MREHTVDFFLHTVPETVDGVEVRMLITGQPDEMNITLEGRFYLAARIKVVHVTVNQRLEHHFRMVWTAAALFIKFAEVFQLQAVNYRVNHTDRIVFRNILVKTMRKKNSLFGIVIPKVYLCRHMILLYIIKIQNFYDMAKPWLVKVRALFY